MGDAHRGGWRAADGRWRPGSPPPSWEQSSDGRWLAPLVLEALPRREPITPETMTTLVSPLRAPRRPPTGAVPAVERVGTSTPPSAPTPPAAHAAGSGTPAGPPSGPLTVPPASSHGDGTAPPPPAGPVLAPPASSHGSGRPPSPTGAVPAPPASSHGDSTAPPPPAGPAPDPLDGPPLAELFDWGSLLSWGENATTAAPTSPSASRPVSDGLSFAPGQARPVATAPDRTDPPRRREGARRFLARREDREDGSASRRAGPAVPRYGSARVDAVPGQGITIRADGEPPAAPVVRPQLTGPDAAVPTGSTGRGGAASGPDGTLSSPAVPISPAGTDAAGDTWPARGAGPVSGEAMPRGPLALASDGATPRPPDSPAPVVGRSFQHGAPPAAAPQAARPMLVIGPDGARPTAAPPANGGRDTIGPAAPAVRGLAHGDVDTGESVTVWVEDTAVPPPAAPGAAVSPIPADAVPAAGAGESGVADPPPPPTAAASQSVEAEQAGAAVPAVHRAGVPTDAEAVAEPAGGTVGPTPDASASHGLAGAAAGAASVAVRAPEDGDHRPADVGTATQDAATTASDEGENAGHRHTADGAETQPSSDAAAAQARNGHDGPNGPAVTVLGPDGRTWGAQAVLSRDPDGVPSAAGAAGVPTVFGLPPRSSGGDRDQPDGSGDGLVPITVGSPVRRRIAAGAAVAVLLGGAVVALVGFGRDDGETATRQTTTTTVSPSTGAPSTRPPTTTTTAPPTTTTVPPTTTSTAPPTTTTTAAPTTTVPPTTTAPPTTVPPTTPPVPDVYYQDCYAAHEAGAAPIYEGEPGYRPELDWDGNGIACEWFGGRD